MALTTSLAEPHEPIHIDSDAGFEEPDLLSGNGVRGGSGTADDPYVISDWRIRASAAQPAVRIHGITVHVHIHNVTVDVAPGTEASLLFHTGGHFDVRNVRVGGEPGAIWFDDVSAVRMERVIVGAGDVYVRDVPSIVAVRNQLGAGTMALAPTGDTTLIKNLVYGRPGADGIVISNSFTDDSWFPTVLEGNQVHHAGRSGISAGSLFTGRVCDNMVLGTSTGDGITLLLNERAQDFLICDNFVRDVADAALDVDRGGAVHVVNNTLRDSLVGFNYQDAAGLVERNFVVGNDVGVRAFGETNPSQLVFRKNVLLENRVAAGSAHDEGPYDLRWNFWGTAEDPRASGDQRNVNRIDGGILYDPWCVDPLCEETRSSETSIPAPGVLVVLVIVATATLTTGARVRTRR